MNKEDFFDLLDRAKDLFAKKNYAPAGLRLEYYNDYYDLHYKIWVVGPGSIDPSLVMATDIYPIKGKIKSKERAEKALAKYKRWFDEWEEFQEWKNENSFE